MIITGGQKKIYIIKNTKKYVMSLVKKTRDYIFVENLHF